MPSISNHVVLGLAYVCAGLVLAAVVATARPSLAAVLVRAKSCDARPSGAAADHPRGSVVPAADSLAPDARPAWSATMCAGLVREGARSGAGLRGLVRG